MDSVMGLELRNRLVAALGLVIPATVLWTYPTIEALAAYLADALVSSERGTPPNAIIPVKAVMNSCVQTHEPESVDEAAAAFALLDAGKGGCWPSGSQPSSVSWKTAPVYATPAI
jgi:hypothetical protein